MKDWQVGILVALIIIGIIIGVGWTLRTSNVRNCAAKSEQSGYPTKYERSQCLVEIAPSLWVRDWEVVYYLDHVEQYEQ